MNRLDTVTEQAARLFLARVASDFDVAGGLVFGSRARGTHQADSDTDVAVLLRGPHGSLYETGMKLSDRSFEVLLDTGVCIQAVPIWEDWWNDPASFSNPALIENIRREGIAL